MTVRLPTFLVIGANKAGTTSLHHYLGQHPDVFMSRVKEPTYFEVAHRNGEPLPANHPFGDQLVYTWDDYTTLFSAAGTARAVGESSTGYLATPEAPEAIYNRLPDARIVAVLRHPVDRAYSQFLMYRRIGLEPIVDFEDALAAQQRRAEKGWPLPFQYAKLSGYGEALARYFAIFPREHIRLYRYELLRDDPGSLLRDLFTFIGVGREARIDVSARLNAAPRPTRRFAVRGRTQPPPELPARTRRRLIQRFREDLGLLDRISGERFSDWLSE